MRTNTGMRDSLARRDLTSDYEGKADVTYKDKMHWSTGIMPFQIIDALPTGSASGVPNATNCTAYLPAKSEIVFFNYGLNDGIPDGMGSNRPATRLDTSILTKGQLPAGQELAIDGFALKASPPKFAFASGALTPAHATFANALQGLTTSGYDAIIYDPGGVFTPTEATIGAATLQEALFCAIRNSATLDISFGAAGNESFAVIAPAYQIPGGHGQVTNLGSAGLADHGCMYEVEDGFRWGLSTVDSGTLQMRLYTYRDVFMPLHLAAAPFGGAKAVPAKLALPLTVFVAGLQVGVYNNPNR